MNALTTLNPDDILLTRKLVAESEAAKAASESVRIRNTCFGAATVVGAAGLSFAALLWAWNQHTDPEAIKDALAKMPPLKVETSGQVTMRDGVVAMKDGTVVLRDGAVVGLDPAATVALADGAKVSVDGTVALEPGATVEVSGTMGLPARPDISTQPVKTEDGEAIKREVTVFSYVDFGDGSVHTGWTYPNGKARVPTSQFCYFARVKTDGLSERIDLAADRRPFTVNRRLLPRFNEALAKCIWFGGAA